MRVKLEDVRFADILAFLTVNRCQAITAAARELKVTPSQVSKAIARLEGQIGIQLLVRTSRGVTISDGGKRVAPLFEEVAGKLRALTRAENRDEERLTIAGTSYLNYLFVPHIATALPEIRLRTLELPPALIRVFAADNFFDFSLTTSAERLPSMWHTVEVGNIRKGLFANPRLAAKLGKDLDRISETPFIGPLYNMNGQFVPVDDSCPLRHSERITGHETQTILLALELASNTDQLVYGPLIAVRGHLDRGALVELNVPGWNVSEPLFVACNSERILKRTATKIISTLTSVLHQLQS